MTLNQITTLLLGLLLTTSGTFAIEPRKDINPALLYWQAFSLYPELSKPENTALFKDWTRETPDTNDMRLAQRFDGAFKFIARARDMQAPCDWGIDPADGPAAIVPNIAKIRTAVNAGLLRARVALDGGNENAAREELIAISVLARNGGTNGALVQLMVHIAAESRILDFIASHFDRFSAQSLLDLRAGLTGRGPSSVSVSQAMVNEKLFFYDWFVEKVEGFRASSNGDDPKFFEKFRELTADVLTTTQNRQTLANQLIQAAGGTSAGLVSYIKVLEPFYQRSIGVAGAPWGESVSRAEALQHDVNTSTNLLVNLFMPNIGRASLKEWQVWFRTAMLVPAWTLKAHGEERFQEACRTGVVGVPLETRRLTLEDGRQAIEVRAKLAQPDLNAVSVFVLGK